MKGFAFLTTGLWLLVSGFSNAILDTNNNGLSDLWEKQHNNGNLFPNTFLATNDEDQDGWTNAKEATAGTDPFNPNPPDGIVTVTITPSLTAGAFTLTWPTVIGKNYQLKVSTDLVTWTNLGDPITSSQNTHAIGINTAQPDNSIASKVFWQVTVSDRDADGDGLTDAEELILNTDPESPQTLLGISDLWLATYFSSILQTNGLAGIDMYSDHDGDGRTNLEEMHGGTNPILPDEPESQQWLIVKGDEEQNVPATRTKQFSIPAGKSAIIIVAVTSEEFVNGYTVPDDVEQFDDILEWNIDLSHGVDISGQISVNDRHYEWLLSQSADRYLDGIPGPVHIEKIQVVTAPYNENLVIDVEISATNVSDGILPSYLAMSVAYTDIDIIHPAGGELAEQKEDDIYNCGIVARKYNNGITDIEPITKLRLKPIKGLYDAKFRLKYESESRYKIFDNQSMTNEVVSQSDEYNADILTEFFIKGYNKSTSLGVESVTLQVMLESDSYDCDSVKFTVADAVFHCWLNLFIPVQWGDLPFLITGGDRIFGGDDRGFYNLPFTNALLDVNNATSSSRIHQQITVVPYKVLDEDGLVEDTIKQAVGVSHNYRKSTSVPHPNLPYSSSTNRLLPSPDITSSGTATGDEINLQTTVTRDSLLTLHDSWSIVNFGVFADNPIVQPSFAIDWSFTLNVGGELLAPQFVLSGVHDGFPACEIYIRDSDGNAGGAAGTIVLQFDPIPLGNTPESLAPSIDDVLETKTGFIE